MHGAMHGDRLGCGLLIWHPSIGIFWTASFGFAAATPTTADGEWAARLHGLHQLAGWQGTVAAVLDSTNTLTSGYTTAPANGTLWSLLFREVFGLRLKARLREIWVPARHTTPRHGVFATLNASSHQLATQAPSRTGATAAVRCVPLHVLQRGLP